MRYFVWGVGMEDANITHKSIMPFKFPGWALSQPSISNMCDGTESHGVGLGFLCIQDRLH